MIVSAYVAWDSTLFGWKLFRNFTWIEENCMILFFFYSFLEKKIPFRTQIQTLDPPDPKGLGQGLKILDPKGLDLDLDPLKKLGSGSGSG